MLGAEHWIEEDTNVKILTTVKRVNNPDAKPRLNSDGTDLVRDGLENKLNDFDEYGVEEAIKIKESVGGDAEIIVVCVGPKDQTKEVRTALAMGGDRAIIVDANPDELDPSSVAQILAAIARKEEPDVVIMGKLSVDTENNQVAQRLAGLLEWPQATFAFNCSIADGWATVEREVDGGTSKVRFPLPGVITADLRLNEPRYAPLPGIMRAKSKPHDYYTPDDLDVEIEAKITTVGFELPATRAAGEIVEDVDDLINRLVNEAKAI